MPDLATYLAFLAAVLAMQATPGPETMLVMSRGFGGGRRIALSTALGCVATGLVQLPLLPLGVASLVAASPLAFALLRWAGAGYLLWLGLALILGRRPDRPAGQAEARRTTSLAAFRQGVAANLTNPNSLVFMLAFLPHFVDPAADWPVAVQLLALGATQKATGLVVLGSVALASGTLGDFLARRPGVLRWQERFAGAVIVALGLRLLLTGDARNAR